MERLKIAVTGPTGFIGANLALHFMKMGHTVYPLMRKSSNKWRLSNSGVKNITHVDIGDRKEVFKVIKKIRPDVLIHTACYGSYPSEKEIGMLYSVNLGGTMNVVDACIDAGVALVINTGTSSEYGSKDRPMKESDTLKPETDYGISKALATQYCTFKSNQKTKIITFRPFSPYGYFEKQSRLMPYVILSCITGGRITLSSPSNVRDFVFIEDVANAYDLAIKNRKRIKGGSIFNLAYGRQHKIADVAKIASKLSKNKLKIEWSGSAMRHGDGVKMWQADINTARKEIGWKPKSDIDVGMAKMLKWMKENKELYDNGKPK